MTKLNKKEIQYLNETYIDERWWNFGKKEKGFQGTFKDYMDKHRVEVSKRYSDKKWMPYYIFKFNSSSTKTTMVKRCVIEDLIYLIADVVGTINLAVGDKSIITFTNEYHSIEKSINYHR